MTFEALAADGALLEADDFYSIGGDFFVDREGLETNNALAPIGHGAEPVVVRFPFHSATELFDICKREKMSIADVVLANETAWTRASEIRPQLLHIWDVMNQSIERGLVTEGILPGGLNVRRRAAQMYKKLCARRKSASPADFMSAYAIAVNEENAAGGRVVTAPVGDVVFGVVVSLFFSSGYST